MKRDPTTLPGKFAQPKENGIANPFSYEISSEMTRLLHPKYHFVGKMREGKWYAKWH